MTVVLGICESTINALCRTLRNDDECNGKWLRD